MPPNGDSLAPAKLRLDAINIRPVENVPDDPDDCTTLEQVEILKGKAEVESVRFDTQARKEYAKKIFLLTCLWVCGIYALMLFQGFGFKGFKLSDNVVLAAIGSTTANIVGVFLIVTRYFFPKKH